MDKSEGPGCGAGGRRRDLDGIRTVTTNPTGVEDTGGIGGPAAVPVGGGGARPGFEPTHRTMHQHRRRRRCGGRRRVRRARAGFEIDHSEPLGSRVAISRAAGPDGAWNTSGAASNKLNHAFQPHHWCGGRRRVRRAQEGLAAVPVGGGGAWPDNEPTRRATHQRPGAAGVEGAGGSGGHGRASRSTTPSL